MRASLLRGVALAALLSASVAEAAPLPAASKTLRQLVGRPQWLPICSRRGVNGSSATTDTTNLAAMDQVYCVAPSWGKVTALKLAYAGFDMPQQGEQDRQITATITASVFQPANRAFSVATNATTASAGTTLSFAGGTQFVSEISVGAQVSSTNIPAADYVTGITRTVGASNSVSSVSVTLAVATTGTITNAQSIAFAGQITPVHFGGVRQVALTPRHDVLTSDPVAVQIAAGGSFWVRTATSFSGTGIMLMDYPGVGSRNIANTVYGVTYSEFDTRGASLTDLTLAPVSGSNSGGGFFGPWYVLGLVTPNNAAAAAPGGVMVLGDSIGAGTGDVADALFLQGYIQRALENNVPFITAARGSTTAQMMVAMGDGQYSGSIDTGITDVLLELGRNDVQQFGVTAATLETYTTTIASRYTAAGKRVWCFTIPPTTYSNDGWTTLANQGFPVTTVTTNGTVTAGATTITINPPGVSPAAGQLVAAGYVSQMVSTTAGSGSSTIVLASATGVATGQPVWGPGISAGTTLSGVTSNTITLSNTTTASTPANVTLDFGGVIAPGTTVSSYASNVITLSAATVGTIATASTLSIGTPTAASSSVEVQREAFNTYVRNASNRGSLGCTGLVDDDAFFADLGGSFKWRVDLGAATVEGVHPNNALHQAAVTGGAIPVSSFVP